MLVGTTHHCSSEITHLARTDRTLVTLGLKEDLEADKRVHLKHSDTIDPTIAASACNFHLLESGFT